MIEKIKVGSKVIYRGCFGHFGPKEAVVSSILKSDNKRDKNGVNVDSIDFIDREYGVFMLSDGYWCYGEQIDSVVSDPDSVELRIVFKSEIYLKGKSIKDIKDKWCELPLFSEDATDKFADVLDIVEVDRTDDGVETETDVTKEFMGNDW